MIFTDQHICRQVSCFPAFRYQNRSGIFTYLFGFLSHKPVVHAQNWYLHDSFSYRFVWIFLPSTSYAELAPISVDCVVQAVFIDFFLGRTDRNCDLMHLRAFLPSMFLTA